MNVQQAVAQILKTEGTEWVGCYPSNNLIEEVAAQGIRTLMFRQERGALMAADGYTRLNDRQKFGVVVTQGGPGSENSMGGLAQAFGDNVPILYLPGGFALNEYYVRPNFSPARTYQSVSKSAEVLLTPDSVSAVMRRAFHALRNGRPGPAVVEIPADVAVMEVPAGALPYQSPKRHVFSPAAGDVKDAVTALLRAKKAVIWSGQGVLLGGASAELTELAELVEVPVFCTLPGKSGFDERHPLSLGAGGGTSSLAARRWIQESDLLLALGSSLTRTNYGQEIPEGKFIIQNTEAIEDINKDYNVSVGLPGDVRATIRMIIEEVKAQVGERGRKGTTQVAAEIAELNKGWMADWDGVLNSSEKPINTYRVIHEIDKALDHDQSIVTHDAGAPRDTMMPFYRATVPHSYVGWGKTTHLGFGIPLMIGAKLARPEKFCLNMMGDGAFGMSGLDIETSVRGGVPITTVVLNNRAMATYPGGYQISRGKFGTTEMSGNYAQIAEGLGARGLVVTEPAQIAGALQEAQRLNQEGRTVLIDVASNEEGRRSRF